MKSMMTQLIPKLVVLGTIGAGLFLTPLAYTEWQAPGAQAEEGWEDPEVIMDEGAEEWSPLEYESEDQGESNTSQTQAKENWMAQQYDEDGDEDEDEDGDEDGDEDEDRW